MKRRARLESAQEAAGQARAEIGELPVEPISVRISVASRLTGISRSTLYELIKAGQIETVKIGRSTFIPFRCLKSLIDP